MKLLYSILISCLLCIGQAQALDLKLYDATSFDPQPVVVSAADNSVPIGTVIIWTKEKIPDGWLECNGQPVNEALYPDLYRLMPIVPNYQGMFLRGSGSQTLDHGQYGIMEHGTNLGEIQGDSIRNITGTITRVFFDVLRGVPPYSFTEGAFKINYSGNNDIAGANDGTIQTVKYIGFDASRVVPTSKENRPVNVGVKYIVKAE